MPQFSPLLLVIKLLKEVLREGRRRLLRLNCKGKGFMNAQSHFLTQIAGWILYHPGSDRGS